MPDIQTITLPDGNTYNLRDDRVDNIPSTQENVVDLIYPIGSIYMSASSTDPGLLFPDTVWTRIKDTFLLASGDTYSADNAFTAVHGEATVTLTGDQSGTSEHTHGHSITVANHASQTTSNYGGFKPSLQVANVATGSYSTSDNPLTYAGANRGTSSKNNSFTGASNTGGSHSHTISGYTHTVSGSITKSAKANAKQAHNNMPPYLAVYMWQRTA